MPNNQMLSSNAHHQSHSTILLSNQNLLHVKFHVNKIQDNLLSKRLKQLNEQEMKLRLKNQRTSNDLVNFLNDCKQSTGYFSKMKPVVNKATSTLGLLEQHRRISKVYSDLESNASSSLDLNCCYDIDDSLTNTTTSSTTKSSRHNGLTRPKLNRHFCFKSLDLDKSCTSSQLESELIRAITPLKSLPESESLADSAHTDEPAHHKMPSLFEQILSRSETESCTPTSTQFSCSNSSQNNSSKASASSRSISSASSSHRDQLQADSHLKRQDSFRKIRPSSCSTVKQKSKPSKSKLSDTTTLSNIDWLSSTFTFDLDLDKKLENESNSSSNIIKKASPINESCKRIPSAKSNESKKKTKQKSFKHSEFKSRSLNLLLNSTDFTTASFSNKTSNSHHADTNTEASRSSFCSTDTTRLSKHSSESKYFTRKALLLKHQQQVFPIQINMSRNLIRKKQIGLINDYKNLNSMEFVKSLRQIQQNLDTKVKQFSRNTTTTTTNPTTIQQTV